MVEVYLRPAHWLRRDDPDETEGRRLYRARAEVDARRSVSMGRKVRYLASTEIAKAGQA